ncbi:MAG: enoyl-CoA hydratase-related protein [Chloroflexota bacterium]|nr:enoyl-CoA hydratase-related protein [Chloroflexota bacterium]
MAELVLSDLHERVLTLTLNQPARLNALSTAMYAALQEALRRAERDETIRAVVLTGAGNGFSSGADLTEFDFADGRAPDVGTDLRARLNPLVLRMRALEKPLLAAINGVAAGAGLSLALACDLRYAAESARLVVAFVRIGLVPDAGALFFLPRLVGPGKALELSWTGNPIGAAEAYDLGLLNEVIPDHEVLGKTQTVAAQLARGPATALALIKRAVNQAHELPLERVLEMEAQYQTIAARQSDFVEGVAAFREKRPARFS